MRRFGAAKKKKGRAKRVAKIAVLAVFFISLAILMAGCASEDAGAAAGQEAAEQGGASPGIIEQLVGLLDSRSASLQLVALLTILTLAPSILILLTGFTRIVIVLSFTRNALGMQQMPPNQVIVGLALLLTFFVMSPVFDQIYTNAYEPYVNEEITFDQALGEAEKPIREFMYRQVDIADINLFMSIAGADQVSLSGDMTNEQKIEALDTVPFRALVPAFVTSEIKRGFMIGFFIYIPFIVVDMIVASTLMAMGMMMLPPIVISLPFKVLMFVVVNGWDLTISSLLTSFNMGLGG